MKNKSIGCLFQASASLTIFTGFLGSIGWLFNCDVDRLLTVSFFSFIVAGFCYLIYKL